MYNCEIEPVYSYVLGILLCIGGMISYFPQYYSLIKAKQSKGISETSLFILNIGSACLAANSVVLNWSKFSCYNQCNSLICTANLLSMIQILVGWIMVFPLYLIFLRYKIKNSDRKIIYDLIYILIYLLFITIVGTIGLTEKMNGAQHFFIISAWILGGIISPICSCIVWIPQIIKLIRTREQGNLSLPMFIMQTPGSVVVMVFQILYHQDWTTWITYVITFVEQGIIVIILIVLKFYPNTVTEINVDEIVTDSEQF